MSRLNYGLALSHNGNYQVILTSYAPGIRDDYSRLLDEPFSFFVAPAIWIEQRNNFHHLQGIQYQQYRDTFINSNPQKLKEDILFYHNASIIVVKSTWSD